MSASTADRPPRTTRPVRRLIRGLAVATTAAALMATAACGGTKGGGSASQTHDTLSIGLVNPVASWNAINQGDVSGQFALSFGLDSLLVQPKPLDFQPKLASSFDTKDDKTYTVKLNPKATWTDGKPVTADDVVYTLNLAANADSATTWGAYLTMFPGTSSQTGKLPKGKDKIPGLTAVDQHTVRFSMKAPIDPNWVKEMIGTHIKIVPQHVLAGTAPSKFDDSKYATLPNVFDGPYKITKYTSNVSVEFTANDKYYLGAPKIKKIILKIMPASNLAGELQTGSIQMIAGGGIGDIPINDLPTVKRMQNVDYSVNKTLDYQTMQFNTKRITSVKFRQGIAHAINRPQIVKQLLKGQGEIIDGPYTSQSPYLDKSIKPTPYDPALAKKLIKQSGWDLSKPLKFVVPTGNETREEAADVIEQNLKAVGVKVQAQRYDFPTVLAMEQKGQFDIGLVGLGATVDPDASNYRSSTGTSNHSFYNNPENDKLLIEAKSEPDPAKRRVIYNKLQKIWQRDMPILTTYAEWWIGAKNKDLVVGGPSPFWLGTTANLQDWRFSNGK